MLTVVVPVYNVRPWLPACVDSLLAQTCREMEILLVDDGSTDESGALCDAYARENPSVRVVHQANAGLSGARNTGILAARGDCLAFVDADDVVSPDFCETMLGAMADHACDMAVCGVERFSDGGCPVFSPEGGETGVWTAEALFTASYHGGIPYVETVVAWNKVIRRAALGDCLFPIGLINEDEHTVYRWIMGCGRVAYCPRMLYGYRQRGGSIVHQSYSEKRLAVLDALKDKAEVFRGAYGEKLYTDAFYDYLEECVRHACAAADAASPLQKGIRERFLRDYPLYRGPWDARRLRLVFYRCAPDVYPVAFRLWKRRYERIHAKKDR